MQRLKDQVNRKHENIEKSEDQDNQVREDQVLEVCRPLIVIIQYRLLSRNNQLLLSFR